MLGIDHGRWFDGCLVLLLGAVSRGRGTKTPKPQETLKNHLFDND